MGKNCTKSLGKQKDAQKYDDLAGKVKEAFNATFFHKETKQYATGTQTANAMAVYMNLVEPLYKDAVVDNIVKDIHSRGKMHLLPEILVTAIYSVCWMIMDGQM